MRPAIIQLASWIFWISVLEVAYSYALYPVLLRLFSRLFGKTPAPADDGLPDVAVVIPVYNEENIVADKITNIFSLNYPAQKLSVWIGSDRSTDRTEEVVRSLGDPRVNPQFHQRIHLWVAPERCGKARVLNALAPQVEAEVLVFTDADVMLDPESVRLLARHFADPAIGGVGGRATLLQTETLENPEEVAYLAFEAAQKKMEAALHSTISAFGSFYAIRKKLFVPFHPHTYSNDDVLMPMNIIRQGYRMLFDYDAVSREKMSRQVGKEFKRRIRIGAGNFQAFFWLLDFLNPKYGWPWFCYVSHKVSRWFSPFFMAGAALTCGFLALGTASMLYKTLFAAGVLFTGAGLLYKAIPLRFPRKVFYFLAMNTALILGFFRFLGGIRSAVWSRTERQV
jgi:cellulose synthase/poly-beta-1,6-N-acetylglucosamine synthase-like glycosyltransferase